MSKIDKLRLDKIYSTYYSGDIKLPVLEDISINVKPGEFVSVLGPSGSGKSTILKLAAGLLGPDKGKVFYDDFDVTGEPRRVGYMPQQDLLFPWKTLKENAALPLLSAGVVRTEAFRQVEQMLPIFGLEGFADYYPNELSGGMRQRGALMRTLLVNSDLLLLDEPFAALDAITREMLQDWLEQIRQRFSHSVLFVTHSIDEAIYLSDRVYIITERPGKIALEQPVTLPRPRKRTLVTGPEFAAYKALLIKTLAREGINKP
ncbi:MAG: ABC transporter ATP-binding protein [Bacillota bacterium]|nr:ABC transporter ATP-binding protein [Bacillota bacterium]